LYDGYKINLKNRFVNSLFFIIYINIKFINLNDENMSDMVKYDEKSSCELIVHCKKWNNDLKFYVLEDFGKI